MSESPQRIGVLGGTFDPIHVGHLAAASEVYAALGLDRVLVVPADIHPFKVGEGVTSAHHRLEMARLAVADDSRLEVSDVDVVRGPPTYTIDTLEDLAAEYPGAEFFFITGADALTRLDEWKGAERLRDFARFVGVTRPGYPLPKNIRNVAFVEVPSFQVSSTDVRARVASGQPIAYLVPASVADYIKKHDLYLGGTDG